MEVRFDLRFNTSNLNYPGIYVHIAWKSFFGGLGGHSGLHMTSEVTSEIKLIFSDLNTLCSSVFMVSECLFSLNET